MKVLQGMAPREFQLLLGGTVVLVAAAVVSFLVVPQVKAWRAAVADHAVLSSIPPQRDPVHEFNALRDEIEGVRRQLLGGTGDLPLQELEAYVIGRLQSISWGHDIALLGIAPGDRQQVEGFHELSFDIQVTGGYLDLFAWLDTINEELGFVVIKEYRMSVLERDSVDPVLRAALTVASYRSAVQ